MRMGLWVAFLVFWSWSSVVRPMESCLVIILLIFERGVICLILPNIVLTHVPLGPLGLFVFVLDGLVCLCLCLLLVSKGSFSFTHVVSVRR